ncbi:MAG: hypothetical protein ACYC27_03235 [Armatimonadota bacterium]
MKLKIDLKRLGKWANREALPVAKVAIINIILDADITDDVKRIADRYGIPEANAEEITKEIRDKLIDKISEVK